MSISAKKSTVTADAVSDAKLPAVPSNEIPTAPEVCPGAQPTPDELVDHYATEIRDRWNKSVEAILVVADRCSKAQNQLGPLHRDRLCERLPFKREMFSKLATLGANKALFADKIRKRLPACWTILYLLRYCTEEELHRAINERVLTPVVTRSELSKWLSENSSRRKEDKRRAEPNKAHHDKLLQGLRRTFVAPPEWADLWRQSPDAVRRQFCQVIMKG